MRELPVTGEIDGLNEALMIETKKLEKGSVMMNPG